MGGVPLPADRAALDPVDHRVLEAEVRRACFQAQRRKAPQKLGEDNLEFEAGEVLAQALVHAEPERDVVAGIPADVPTGYRDGWLPG